MGPLNRILGENRGAVAYRFRLRHDRVGAEGQFVILIDTLCLAALPHELSV